MVTCDRQLRVKGSNFAIFLCPCFRCLPIAAKFTDRETHCLSLQVVHKLSEEMTLSPIVSLSSGCQPEGGFSLTRQLTELGLYSLLSTRLYWNGITRKGDLYFIPRSSDLMLGLGLSFKKKWKDDSFQVIHSFIALPAFDASSLEDLVGIFQ